jgi:lipopolysaccharide export LptBFGC system permease protein LptF
MKLLEVLKISLAILKKFSKVNNIKITVAAASEREKLQASFKSETKENTTAVSENDAKTKNSTTDSRWTSEQQSALEKALVTFPASLFKQNPASRWDKVAEVVPGKTVSQVKARVKELSELVSKSK